MIGADIGRFLLIATIPVAVWLGLANIELLYAAVFAAGVLTVLYQVADFAFLPSLVRENQLVDASGKLQATGSASEIGGRGIGGILVQTISAPVAVGVNALCYLASALSLSRIRQAGLEQEPGESASGLTSEPRTARREVWEGLRMAVANRFVGPLLGEADRLITWGAIPLGAATGGLAASIVDGQFAMLAGAAGMAASTVWVAFSGVPPLRSIADARMAVAAPAEDGRRKS